MSRQLATAIVLALSVVSSGCEDATVITPTDSSNLKYTFHVLDGSAAFGGVEVFLMRDEFSVYDSGILRHRYSDKYNGCVRINAVFSETEAEMFTFINWMRVENRLILDLNLSPEPDWTMVIKNDDGGKLEAIMTGNTSDGLLREHLLEGASPKPDDGEVCTRNANAI